VRGDLLATDQSQPTSHHTSHFTTSQTRTSHFTPAPLKKYVKLLKIVDWLHQHNPFIRCDTRLTALQSGVTANDSDGVTCDSAYIIGSSIHVAFDGVPFVDASINKKSCVKTMSRLIAQGQQADKRLVDTDSFTLYYRLIILVERSSNIASYFRYELTTTPCSLFHGYMLNESGKAALGKILKEDVGC